MRESGDHMEKTILFATGNRDKLREIRMIMEGSGFDILSMGEAGIDTEIEENGSTFEENALIKARTVAALSGHIAMADDSGLEIDFLDGAPGIYSARFLGEDTPHSEKNKAILEKLRDVPDEERTARFVCAIACVFPDGREMTCRETMEGRIAYQAEGQNGFGYDPIFFLPEYGCTSASLPPEEKNRISHRGKALRKMRDLLLAEGGDGIEKTPGGE